MYTRKGSSILINKLGVQVFSIYVKPMLLICICISVPIFIDIFFKRTHYVNL